MGKRQIKRTASRNASQGRYKPPLPEIKKLADFVAADIQRQAADRGQPVEDDFHVYRMGKCRIFVGHSPAGWHLSISHPSRYPRWDEIKAARYACVPTDKTMAMLLPPESEYVNADPNCFHLWEIPTRKETET